MNGWFRALRTARVAFVAASGLASFASRAANAQSSNRMPVTLEWAAPANCPTRDHVVAEIARLLGHPAETAATQPLTARANVSLVENGSWQLRLETITRDGAETRTMDGSTCVEVADATALILAMAIDPDAVRPASASSGPVDASSAPPTPIASSAPPTAVESLPSAAPVIAASPAPSSSAPPASDRPWHITIRTTATVDFGTFAAAGAGTEIAMGVLFSRVRIELSATYWLPQFTPIAPPSVQGGVISMVEAGARGCFVLARVPVADFETCVRFDLGSMIGTGQGVLFPTTGSALWGAAMAGLGGGLSPVRGLSFRAYVDGGATLLAPTFVITGIGQVHQSSPAFVRGQIGVEVHF